MTQANFSASDNALTEQDPNGLDSLDGEKRGDAMAVAGEPLKEGIADLGQELLIEHAVRETLKSAVQLEVGGSVAQEGIRQNQAEYGFSSQGEVVQEEKPSTHKPLALEKVGSATQAGRLPNYKEDGDRMVDGGPAIQERRASVIREESKIASQASPVTQDVGRLIKKVDPVIQEKSGPAAQEDAALTIQQTSITTQDDGRIVEVKPIVREHSGPIAQEDATRSAQETSSITQVVGRMAEDIALVIQEKLKHTDQHASRHASSVDRGIQLDSSEILGDEIQNPEIRECVVQSILEGVTRVVSYPGTSQYSTGAGTSACGLASLNCARVLLAKDYDNTDPSSFISSLISRETVEVRDCLH
jgi:hypothetical protein